MPPKAKRYLITTETSEIVVVRRNGHRGIAGFCPICQKEVEMLNLVSAVSLTGIGAREIFRLIEEGQIHSLETPGGQLLVCRDSLKK